MDLESGRPSDHLLSPFRDTISFNPLNNDYSHFMRLLVGKRPNTEPQGPATALS